MARKVIDIIYNLVRKRMTLKGDGTGITTGKITSLPNSAQVERGMQTIFNRLKQGGYNVVSAEKVIKNEDDLARILEEINQAEIAQIKRRKDASEGIETVIDKMNRGIPLNPGDQAKIEGAGMKTTLDAFRGFEPKVIPGGKMSGIEAMKEANLLIGRKGKYKNISESDAKTKLNELQEIINKANAEPDLGTKLKNFDGDPDAMAGGGLAGALAKLKKKFGKDVVQKGKAPKKSEKKKLQDMFRDFNRKNKAEGGISDLPTPMNRKPDNVEEDKNFEDFFLRKPLPVTPESKLEDVMKPLQSEENLSGNFGILSENADISREIERKIIEKENQYMKRTGKVPPEFFSDKLRIQLQEEFLRQNKAGGGLAYMLGEPREEMAAGGIPLRRLLQFLAEQSGKKGSQGLKEMRLPKQIKFFAEKQGFNPDQARIEYLEQVLESLKADKKLIKGLEPSSGKDAMEEVADSLFKTEIVDKTQSGRFRGLDSEMIDSSIMELETILKNLKTKDQGRKLNAEGGRIGFADGGMSRRTFLKIMAALAAFPVVGKLAKTAKVAKGAAPMVTPTAEMPAHFPKLVEKILREGQVVDSQFVKKTGDIKTYKHPDRPDMELTIEGEGDRITLDFETDQGMRGGYEFKKGSPDEMAPNPPNEFEAGEVKYKMSPDGDYSKDFELGIDTGTENLDEFAGVGKQKTSKSKVNLPESLDDDFADGGLAGLLGE
jgi:hypothetical protein